ncbi:MAG: hypothetical protein KKB50_06065 [Planctomycetes bacterium]|nr:hypothetical protein [Planctomycetota bacterium]
MQPSRSASGLLALAVSVGLVCGIPSATAVERLVPDPYTTIQEAIEACSPGDVVIVADGIYTGFGNVNVSLMGMAITVRSANGPANCIIDCEGCTSGFYLSLYEGPNSVVDGFTVINHGGG